MEQSVFSLVKKRKKLQRKSKRKKILKVFFSALTKLIKRLIIIINTSQSIKKKEFNIIAGKELPSKIIKKKINIQQLVFQISNLQEEVKGLSRKIKKQEIYSLDNIIKRLEFLFKKGNSKRIETFKLNISKKQLGLEISYKNKSWSLLSKKHQHKHYQDLDGDRIKKDYKQKTNQISKEEILLLQEQEAFVQEFLKLLELQEKLLAQRIRKILEALLQENDVKYFLKQQEQEIKETEKTLMKINSLESQE